MTAPPSEAKGLAFRCSAAGQVLEIICDDLRTGLRPGHRLGERVSPGSCKDALRLLAYLFENEAAFGWQLEFMRAGIGHNLHVAASSVANFRVVIAATDLSDVAALYERMLGAEEQPLGRNLAVPARPTVSATNFGNAETALLDEYTRLNNELITLRRELERRNGQLHNANALLEINVSERTRQLQISNAHLLDLTRSMAHDLAIPVRGIHSFAALLVEEHAGQLDPEGLALLKRLQEAALRLGAEMDGLRRIERVSRAPVHPRAVDVTALATKLRTALQQRYPADRTSFFAEPGMSLHTDRHLLGEALHELLDNALKFSAPKPSAEISVHLEREDDDAVLVVTDTGIGLDPNHVERLFHPFERLQLPGDFAGQGIGLAVVGRVADQLGATVAIDGRPDEGVSVRLRFPLGTRRR